MNEKNKNKRLMIVRGFLLFWTIFIGLGAVLGSTCMFIDPTGKIMEMDGLMPYFQVLPFASILFQNYIFPGISLLIVNGITNITAFILILLKKKSGYILGTIFGFTLMLWIIIQFVIFPFYFIDLFFFIFGLLQFITGIVCIIFYEQTCFSFKEEDYKDINSDAKTLVIFFSRMGYAKKLAYEIANKEKAEIVELTPIEKVSNTSGFWWCGRFGMHRWPMKLNEIKKDFSKYEKIVIVGQIWVFRISSPIRELLIDNSKSINKAKNVSMYLVHFNPYLPKKAEDEVHKYLTNCEITSVTSHYGKITIKE